MATPAGGAGSGGGGGGKDGATATETSKQQRKKTSKTKISPDQILNVNVGILGHVDSGKTSLGE